MSNSEIDLARLAGMIPDGVPRGSDKSSFITGTVTGLDIPAAQVQVVVAGSEPIWLPANPFIYEPGSAVRLRRSPVDGGRVVFCEGPIRPGPMVATGTVKAVGDDLLTVTVLGSDVDLMFSSSTYEVGDEVLVLRHATGFGVPQVVLGLAGLERPAADPGQGAPNPVQTVTRQATVGPQNSGTFRVSYNRWDAWNPNAAHHGGAPSLWQGNDYGSGQLIGWAGYGDQIVNLHAKRITKMWVDVIRADSSVTASRALVVQGSPSGTRPGGAPDGSGDTAGTGALPRGGSQRIELPASTYEAWRTGGFKGLRTVGGDYMAAAGTNRGGALALTVQFEVDG